MYWINVISFFHMLMSGPGIFNAHPHLYRSRASDFDAPLLSMTARPGPGTASRCACPSNPNSATSRPST